MNLNKIKKYIVVNVREHTFARTFEPLSKYDTAEIFTVSLYQLSRIFLMHRQETSRKYQSWFLVAEDIEFEKTT